MEENYLQVFSKDFILLGTIGIYHSLVIEHYYNNVDILTLVLSAKEKNNNILKLENLICLKNRKNHFFVILATNRIDDTLTVRAENVLTYLSRRINLGTLETNNTISQIIYKLINDNCIDTTINRIIPYLQFENNDFSREVEYTNSYGNILEEVLLLCQNHNFGIKTITDVKVKKHTIKIYTGVYRGLHQYEYPRIILTKDNNNLTFLEITNDITDHKNMVYVAGQGEAEERLIVDIGNDIDGLNRKEIFVDARDIGKDENNRELSIEKQKELLIARGNEKLIDYQKVEAVSGTMSDYKYTFKTDYNLGDIVTFVDKDGESENYYDSQITRVVETFESGGYTITPTLGTPLPTLKNILKKVKGG